MQTEEQNINEEQELYENYRIEVEKGQKILRIDKYLMMRIEGTSRNKIQTAAKAGCVKVNNAVVKEGTAVVDANNQTAPVLQVRHPNHAGQRQRSVRRRQIVHIVQFAVCRYAIMKIRAVP